MKSILFIICIVFSITAYSQQLENGDLTKTFQQLDPLSKLEFQHDYTRFCMKKYHDEKMTGYKIQLAGLLLTGAAFIVPLPETETIDGSYTIIKKDYAFRNIASIGGGVVTLVGLIVSIDSEKWMKRAYIGPDGIGVRFKF